MLTSESDTIQRSLVCWTLTFGCLCVIDILTQEMTVSIYVTWLHIVKGFERPFKLYSDIIQSYSYSTTNLIKFIAL